ncbi:hypothetical protein IWW48_004502 [Coemansia sp. RSA 1200]|nr:hypothetical protein IWW48_004502 [Coemansia sp. RSA 1200]
MDNNEKPLFIKDGDDVFIQRNSNDSESNNPTYGIRTSVYKHFESNMRVVVCRTSSPIFTLNIYVPTASTNDKGIPHTLEHLVFCGSKRYPTRGYMDALAAHNYSMGTNAWTSVDHTCYTLAAAAEDAVANVLPVFLDHILNPLLLDEHFVTEVYHYDETGKEKGVVFSEMTLYENDEMARGYYRLNSLMYNSGATYVHCNGGRTSDIAKLTIEEIIDYHRKYYDANNITVVLTGTFSDEFEETYLQAIPADIVQSRGSDSRAPMDCSPRRDGHPRHDSLRFPSSNTSSGTINFGWHGPEHQDVETRVALEILKEYLVGTSSSPLNLRFVERSSPLASSVKMNMECSINKAIKMWFSGVPYASQSSNNNNGQMVASKDDKMEDAKGSEETLHLFEEHYLENILASEFQRIYDTRFDGDELALEKAAKRVTSLMTAAIEDKQIEFLQRMQLIPDIVASHFSSEPDGNLHIGSLARQFDVIAELAKKPIEYWLALLKKWLIDGTVYSVAMIPDIELGSKLEAERKEKELANAAKIVDEDAHATFIKTAVEKSKSNVSDEMKRGMAKPDPSPKTATLPHKQNLVVLDKAIGPVTAVQTINADSGFVETQIQIPIRDIPDELRAYLAVFQDVLLDTDLVLPAGVVYDNDKEALKNEKRIQYSEFASKMADIATLRYSCVGQGLEQLSFKGLDSFFVVDFSATCNNYLLALRWTIQGIVFSEFTPDRILTCVQNLLASIASKKRTADSILLTVESHFTDVLPGNEQLSNKRHMSFLAQEAVLANIIKDAKSGKVDEIIAKLKDIQNILVRATGGFMALSLPSRENSKPYIDAFENEWKMCYDQYAKGNNDNDGLAPSVDANAVNKSPFPIAYNSRFPELAKPLFIHVPVESLQTSMALFSRKLDIPFYPTGKRSFNEELTDLISLDYFALQMLSGLLGSSDAPLSNAVRSKGYSYGVHVYTVPSSRKLLLRVYQASDVVKAIGAIKQLLVDMRKNWDSYISDSDVSKGRSIMKYRIVASQSTTKMMLAQSIFNSVNGFDSVEQYNTWCNTHIAAVKASDLRRVFEKYVFGFADSDCTMLRLVVTPSNVEVPAELGPYEKKTLEEISATYKTDY